MITGSNTNIRYRGKVFHVQTEDSGKAHPHIISHVFYGGTILSSEKSEYEELLDSEDLTGEVRSLIELQHKLMLGRLTHGELDAVIAERLGDPAFSSAANGDGTDTSPALPAEDSATASPMDSGRLTVPTPLEEASAQAEPPAAATSDASEKRAFGEGPAAEKPLDEVILDYLVEKARTRGGDRDKQRGPDA